MRLVVKVGTSVIKEKEYFDRISREIDFMKRKGHEILLVSSGAIGLGMELLGMKNRPREIKVRQTCASLGQALLIEHYRKAFRKYNILVSQVLLTYDVFNNRMTFLNLKNCINDSLKRGVIPIFNENDVISVKEIDTSFGDNDYLSFLVAQHFNADALIMLTSVDGLYTKNPRSKGAELIKVITPHDKKNIKIGGKSDGGIGGMESKLKVGFLCMKYGINMYIINGNKKDSLINYDVSGTRFIPSENNLTGKQRWILTTKPKGKIYVDKKAYEALRNGNNLLFAGIKKVSGEFKEGDVISIYVGEKEVAKVISDYNHSVISRNKSKRSSEIKEQHANIHKRENLVFT